MSRSKHGVELCALLVDETYGELTSRIFTILLRRGRLPIHLLSKHTRIGAIRLKHGLVVLVQQNLVYHHVDETGTTYYEANSDVAYGLVRSGKIMEAVESRFGVLAKDVVQSLLQLGHTKVSDLVRAFEAKDKQINGHANGHATASGTKGVNGNGNAITAGQLHSVLAQLLQTGLIEPVTEKMFRSPTDTYNMVEKEMLQLHYGGSTKGVKQKEELKNKVRDRLQSLRDESRDWKPKAGKKRPLNGELSNGINGSGKRRRLSNGAVNGDHTYEDDGTRLDPNMILRINYEKCTVSLRNQRLVELASSRIGETTAQVYAELLRLLEDKIPRCRLDTKIDDTEDLPDGPSVTTREIAASLSRSVNVGSGIGKASEDAIDATMGHKTTGSRKRKADEAEVDGEASADEEEDGDDADDVNGDGNIPEVDLDDLDDPFADYITTKAPKRAKVTFQDKLPKPEHTEDRQNRTRQIKDHLSLLAGDSCKFVRNSGGRGEGEWTVDFDRIIAHLQEAELDQMLLENFGRTGHRLARMMRTLGKLEEKQLPTLAFMKQKDVRTKLAEMQMAGMIDIQEVPRDNSRTTGRTIFLWYFDTERVSTLMLDSIYKSMSRCIQRLDIEKRRAQDILSLTERSDVRDLIEEDYLDQSQINQLQEIRRKEESLLGQIGRLDDLVGIFRDY